VSEQILRKTPGSGQGVRLRVRLEQSETELDLIPHSLRSPLCEAFVEGPGGARTRVELPPSVTYQGTVRGGAKGIVAATIVGDEIRARIVLEDGTDWYVEPLGNRPAGTHAVYQSTDVSETPGACGMEDGAPTVRTDPALQAPSFDLPGESLDSGPLLTADPLQAPSVVSSGCVEAEIAIEADHAFYVRNGSTTAQTIADIDAVMNSVELIYARDSRISYRITQYLIQTVAGKYPVTDAAQMMSQFRDWWNANQGSVPRDLAHLMTGATLSGYIGYANIAVVCDRSAAYGLSRSTSSVFANRVGLTAHELGHNWGASHCNSFEDCWIMCSTINGCDQDPTRMSLTSISEIEAYRNLSGICLAAGTGTPSPLNPTARDDRAVAVRNGSTTVRVLENDFDANCQSISVGGYASTTPPGGTVSLSGDALVYRPAPGFVGQDAFPYTVRDGVGAQSTATVTVDVEELKPAEDSAGTVAGLQVRYYYVPPLDGDLSSMPTLTNPFRIETVPVLSFPETSGEFGESGLVDKVGARCTGTITTTGADTYTFYLTSDDGAKLTIDGVVRINHDGIHNMIERSASFYLGAGPHTVRVDYYDSTGPAGLRLEWRRGSGPRGVIPATAWGASGVQVAYYHLDSSVLPKLDALVPEKTAKVSNLNVPFSWGAFAGSGRAQHVGAVYEGLITVPSDGVYTFELTSEDGSRLTIGDRVVVDNDGIHNRASSSGGIALRAGAHRARVEYFLREQGCALTLHVSSATLAKQVVPASWWRHMPVAYVPNQYATIRAAIGAAQAGSVVWVAPGTYTGAGNRDLDLGGKSIRLTSGGGPALTVLDAQGLSRVFHFVNHGQPSAVVEGFTITGGLAESGSGGAMGFENSTLQVRNCVIQGNSSAWNGGGIGLSDMSNPIFESCVISGNAAGGAGGAVHAESGARPTFVGCTVSGNRASTSGGGVHVVGGGAVTFDRSILWQNGAGTEGAEAWTADTGSELSFSCSSVSAVGIGGSGTEVYGVGNQFANPRFCAPVAPSHAPTLGGGYRVASTSPVLASSCGTRIGALDQGCAATVTAVESADAAPQAVRLRQNVPNPFNPHTRISFALARGGAASLRVFDVAGRLVTTLVDRVLTAGEHTVTWDGESDRGQTVSSGIYFYRLRTDEGEETRSMVLLQ
jgi:Metallo-peptidase family M12/PA14 domain/Bacterial Ig domain/Right handed beta helix region/FlgD Ig-like domain